MSNPWRDVNGDVTAPAIGALAITPSDSVPLARPIRALTIGTDAGAVSYRWQGVTHTTGPLPVGTYALRADQILATGTTATGLTGWL
jgi:hypothetical protein